MFVYVFSVTSTACNSHFLHVCAEPSQSSSSSSSLSSDAPAPVDHVLASVPAAELQVASDKVGSMLLLTENSGQNVLVEASNQVSESQMVENGSDSSSGSESHDHVQSSESEWSGWDDEPLGNGSGRNLAALEDPENVVPTSIQRLIQHQADSEPDEDSDDEGSNLERKITNTHPNFDFMSNAIFETVTPAIFKFKPDAKPKVRLQDPSAVECFDRVFPYDLWMKMQQETNVQGLKLAQKDNAKRKRALPWINTSVAELKLLHGLFIGMTMMNYRNLDWYWLKGKFGCLRWPDFGAWMTKSLSFFLSLESLSLFLPLSRISLSLSSSLSNLPPTHKYTHAYTHTRTHRRRFRLLFRALHFNDDATNPKPGEEGHDKLHKLAPVITILNNAWISQWDPGWAYSIDEMMVAFKGRTHLRQGGSRSSHA